MDPTKKRTFSKRYGILISKEERIGRKGKGAREAEEKGRGEARRLLLINVITGSWNQYLMVIIGACPRAVVLRSM